MDYVKKGLDKVLGTLCISLFGFLVLLVTWQVITRFVFNDPSVFSEELAKYCFVWLVLFGSAYVFGEAGHMSIEFIKDKFPQKLKMAVEIFIEFVVIVFAYLILIKGGSAVTELAWTQLSASLKIPVGYLYAAMPASGVCIIFYCIYNILLILRKKKPLEELTEVKQEGGI